MARLQKLKPLAMTGSSGGHKDSTHPSAHLSPYFRPLSPNFRRHTLPAPVSVTIHSSSADAVSVPSSKTSTTLNVDSPAFTPANLQAAQATNSSKKISPLTTQAASAAPFTPRGVGGTLKDFISHYRASIQPNTPLLGS